MIVNSIIDGAGIIGGLLMFALAYRLQQTWTPIPKEKKRTVTLLIVLGALLIAVSVGIFLVQVIIG